MTSTTISDTGPVIAASRLIRRRVWGHSVIATRIVVPSSLARLTFPSPSCASVVTRWGSPWGSWHRRGNGCACVVLLG
jgi:hypothetical protein